MSAQPRQRQTITRTGHGSALANIGNSVLATLNGVARNTSRLVDILYEDFHLAIRCGQPDTPQALTGHAQLVFSGGRHQGQWQLQRDEYACLSAMPAPPLPSPQRHRQLVRHRAGCTHPQTSHPGGDRPGGQLYLVDRHHFANALLRVGLREAPVQVFSGSLHR